MARVRRGRRGRRQFHLPDITLTPLIDTALTLLIIFMIATPMMHNSIKISLPKGQVKETTEPPKQLVVSLDKDKKIALDGKKLSFSGLVQEVNKKVVGKKDQTVFVKADTASNYGQVIKIVDELKRIKGVSYVALATERFSKAGA